VTTPPAPAQTAVSQRRACLVTLAGYRFAVEVRHAREVVVFDEYNVVPLAPPYLLGVASLRGNIMPVVDVRPLLGMAPALVGHEVRALVVEHDAVKVGLLIDEVLGLEPLDAPSPADDGDDPGARHVIAGRLQREGGDVALLDVRALLMAMGGNAEKTS
jgi:twitching motility protein PilI